MYNDLIKNLREQVRAKFNDLAYEDITLCEYKLTSKEQLIKIAKYMVKSVDTGFEATDTMINCEIVKMIMDIYNNDYIVVLDDYGDLEKITFTKD